MGEAARRQTLCSPQSKGRSFILPSPFPAEKLPVFLSLIGLFAGHDAGHWAQALPVSPLSFPEFPLLFLALLFQWNHSLHGGLSPFL